MRIPRPELITEELAYHRKQVGVLTALLAISQKHHAEKRTGNRVRWRQRKQKAREAAPACGCAKDQKPKVKPCRKQSTGSSR